MRKLMFSCLGVLFLAFGQAYAADTITGAVYDDTDDDGQVETITVTFDESITCTSGPGANGWSVSTAGSIGVLSVDSVTCSGSTDVVLTISASADITGGATNPELDYATASGDLTGAGSITDKTGQAVTDSADPFLLSFTSSAGDGTYGPTSAINVTATYSEDISSGSLTVSMDTGATGIVLTCGGGSPTCSGSYTVGATGSGEDSTDLEVASISTESVSDGTNSQSSSSVPTTNISTASDIVVDTTAPTLSPVSIASDNGTNTAFATAGDTVTISFTASETIGTPTVTIDGNAADSISNPSGDNWTATRAMQAGDTESTVAFTIDFADTASGSTNAGTQVTGTTDASSVTYDETAPGLVIGDDILAGPVQSDDYIVTETETNPNSLEYGFSADATCDAGDTYGNALTSAVAETFNTETNNGNYVCTRSIDSAGLTTYSSASANTLNIDVTAPTSTITTSVSPIYEGALTQTVTVTYNESMNNATSPSISFTGSTNFSSNADGAWSTTTNTDDTYTETFTHDATEEEVASVTADISAGSATDLAGNTEAAPSSSAGFEVDTDVPSISSAVTDDTDANGHIDEIVVTFSEDLNGSTVNASGTDFDVTGYTVTAASETAPGVVTLTLTEIVSYDTAVTPTVSIAAAQGIQDLDGNELNSGDSGDSVVSTDGALPFLRYFDSSTADDTYGPTSGINIRVWYSESVTGSITVDLNNTVTGIVLTCSGATSCSGTYTVGALGSGEDTADLGVTISSESVTDGAANSQTGSTIPASQNLSDNADIVIDVTAPSVTSITADTNPVYQGDLTTEVVVVFSETMNTAVTPTVGADTSTNFSAGSGVWSTTTNTDDTFTVTLTHSGAEEEIASETVSVSGGEDPGTNTATGSTTSAFVLDTQYPNLSSFTSSTADDTYGPTSAINVTATYDENVTGSLSVDLNNTVTGISLTCSGTTTCTGTYTVGATGSGQDITDLSVSSIASESVTDDNGNNETGSAVPGTNIATGSDINVDVTAPTLSPVSIASNFITGLAVQGTDITLSFTADEPIVSTPTVVISGSDSDELTSCGATTDTSAGARTSWEEVCDTKTTDADGVVIFTIDFVDDYGNVGTQVTSVTDATSVSIDISGNAGGSGGSAPRGEDNEDDELQDNEDEDVLIDNDDKDENEDEEEDQDEDENEDEEDDNKDEDDAKTSKADAPMCTVHDCTRKGNDTFMDFQRHLVCAGAAVAASDCDEARCSSNATRKEVTGIAVKIGNHKTFAPSSYTRHFSDLNYDDAGDWVPGIAETGLGLGFISPTNSAFEPNQAATRAEAVGVFLKSACAAVPNSSSDWQRNVHAAAIGLGLTNRSFNEWKADRPISRGELFVVGSRLVDIVNVTGGCYAAQVCK